MESTGGPGPAYYVLLKYLYNIHSVLQNSNLCRLACIILCQSGEIVLALSAALMPHTKMMVGFWHATLHHRQLPLPRMPRLQIICSCERNVETPTRPCAALRTGPGRKTRVSPAPRRAHEGAARVPGAGPRRRKAERAKRRAHSAPAPLSFPSVAMVARGHGHSSQLLLCLALSS